MRNRSTIIASDFKPDPRFKTCKLHPKLFDYFKELDMLVDAQKNKVTYSRHAAPSSRMHVGRFIRSQPYWTKLSPQPIPKKIILNYWQLITSSNCDELIGLWHFLISQGFEFYFYHKSKELILIRAINTFFNLSNKHLEIMRNDDLRRELSQTGHDIEQYYLLNHIALKKIVEVTNDLKITKIVGRNVSGEMRQIYC